jgi:hypothetical protein
VCVGGRGRTYISGMEDALTEEEEEEVAPLPPRRHELYIYLERYFPEIDKNTWVVCDRQTNAHERKCNHIDICDKHVKKSVDRKIISSYKCLCLFPQACKGPIMGGTSSSSANDDVFRKHYHCVCGETILNCHYIRGIGPDGSEVVVVVGSKCIQRFGIQRGCVLCNKTVGSRSGVPLMRTMCTDCKSDLASNSIDARLLRPSDENDDSRVRAFVHEQRQMTFEERLAYKTKLLTCPPGVEDMLFKKSRWRSTVENGRTIRTLKLTEKTTAKTVWECIDEVQGEYNKRKEKSRENRERVQMGMEDMLLIHRNEKKWREQNREWSECSQMSEEEELTRRNDKAEEENVRKRKCEERDHQPVEGQVRQPLKRKLARRDKSENTQLMEVVESLQTGEKIPVCTFKKTDKGGWGLCVEYDDVVLRKGQVVAVKKKDGTCQFQEIGDAIGNNVWSFRDAPIAYKTMIAKDYCKPRIYVSFGYDHAVEVHLPYSTDPSFREKLRVSYNALWQASNKTWAVRDPYKVDVFKYLVQFFTIHFMA